TAAQQDAALMLGHAPDHEAWVLIVDGAARRAHVTGQRIALGDTQPDRSAALVAELHDARSEDTGDTGACRRWVSAGAQRAGRASSAALGKPGAQCSSPNTATPVWVPTNTLPSAMVGV